jgi:hypothetical protein
MSIVFYELQFSRPVEQSVDTKAVTRKWIAVRDTDENNIATAFLALIPGTYDSLQLQGYNLDPLGGGVWMCTANWALSPYTLPTSTFSSLSINFEFDITAGQQHITQSLQTRYRWLPTDPVAKGKNLQVDAVTNTIVYPDGYTTVVGDVGKYVEIANGPTGWVNGAYLINSVVPGAPGIGSWTLASSPAPIGSTGGVWQLITANTIAAIGSNFQGNAPDHKQSIGASTDRIEGVDIYVPKIEFTYRTQIEPFNVAYIQTVRNTVAKYNNAPFKGFDTGEVLYLGCTAQCTPGGVWQVQHKFAVGQNLYAVPVSVNAATGQPDIIIPFKGGWEYLWCAYGLSAVADQIIQTPSAAYVEQVYRSADFTLLGIGS